MTAETQIPLIHQETQKESSPAAGGPPVFNLGLSGEDPPSFLRETNPIATHPSNPPTTNYEPRTTNSIMRNEPNPEPAPQSTNHQRRTMNYLCQNEPNPGTSGILPASPAPQLCETNPIPTYPSNPPTTNSIMQNKPNLQPRPTTKMLSEAKSAVADQNEPNCRAAGVSPGSPPRIAQNEPNSRTGKACRAPTMQKTNPICHAPRHPAVPAKIRGCFFSRMRLSCSK